MADDHYMPLFVGDFLGATATWDGEERGLYAICLMVEWSSGPLPADASKLQRVLGYPQESFGRLWPTVSQKFKRTHRGLINERLESIREKNIRIHEAKSSQAREAALKSWETRRERNAGASADAQASAHADASANAMHPIRSESDPNPIRTDPRVNPRARDTEPTPEEILADYPDTPNGNRLNALRQISRLISSGERGAFDLQADTRRFARFVKAGGRSRPQMVMGPDKFFVATCADDPAPWSKSWELPKPNGVDQESADVWDALLKSDGAFQRGTPRMERALQAVGGWPAIRLRTERNEKQLRHDFCEAYSAGVNGDATQ